MDIRRITIDFNKALGQVNLSADGKYKEIHNLNYTTDLGMIVQEYYYKVKKNGKKLNI